MNCCLLILKEFYIIKFCWLICGSIIVKTTTTITKAMYCNQTVHFWLEVSLCINSCMQLLYDYTNLMMVIIIIRGVGGGGGGGERREEEHNMKLYLRVVWWSQTHRSSQSGGSGDMAIPNLFWRNVEVVSVPPPLYLNFYRKLVMIAKRSIERVADTYRNFYLC